MVKFIIDFFKGLFKKEIENEKGKGWVEDQVDFRDILLEAISKKHIDLPENYSIPYKLTIKHQGNLPHCVGFSCSLIKDFLERREQNYIDFSGSWIYTEAKKIDGLPPNTNGTFFRSGLKILKDIGAMPVDGGEPSKFRVGGYAKVSPDFQSIKEAIYRYGVVLVGFTMSNEGWKNANVRSPKADERKFGHAVACIGFDKDKIIFQNSWGDWGFDGYGYFTKDYLPMIAYCVLVDLPNNWKELLGKDNDKPKHFFRENLRRGMRGREVVMIQDCLKYIGCFDKKIESSGYFGPITLSAVICFQKRENIKPSVGFCGPITRKRLNEIFK